MTWQVSIDELDTFAAQFWSAVKETRVFAFHGPMGAGKTTTIGALCRLKGVTEAVSSPTFSIINEYSYPADGAPQTMYHIDLYRLRDEEEVVQAGVEDCVDSGQICFVEWPEKAPYLFDDNSLHIVITPLNERARMVKILTSEAYKNQSLAEQL